MRRWAVSLCLSVILACGDDAGPEEEDEQDVEDSGVVHDAGVLQDARNASPDARVDASQGGDAKVGLEDAGMGGDARVGDGGKPAASWLISPGDKVFFVGNSFFGYQDRPLNEWVEAIGRAVTPKFPIETGSHIQFGEMPLSWFLEQKASQDAIQSGMYDVFILQGEDTEPIDDKQGFFRAVRDYHSAITAKGGRVMLFMTWDWRWSGGPDSMDYEALRSAYDEIGAKLDIPVIPVGTIYNDTEKDPYLGMSKWFLTADDLHQVASGSAVNAYATFGMLTGIDAMGVDFDAPNNDNTPGMLKYCSDKAWPRVLERLHD